MAKKKISEFDDFDDGLDFPELDDKSFDSFGEGEDMDFDSDSDRTPASKSKSLFRKGMSGVKSIGVGVSKAVQSAVQQQFPTTTGILSDVKYGVGSLKEELSNVNSDVAPAMQELKQFKRRVTPKIKSALGITASDVSEDDDDGYSSSSTSDPNAEMDAKIKGDISAIFKAERKRSNRKAKIDEIDKNVDKLITTKRHAKQIDLMQDMKSVSLLQHGFNREIFTPYLKKTLELKYRHLYVAQETLALQRSMASALEGKLEQIRHNTALPDEAKVQLSEVLSNTMKKDFSTRINNTIQDTIQNIFKHNIDENIKPITDMIGMPISMLGMMLDSQEMEEEMVEMTGSKPKSLARSGFETLLGGVLGHKFNKGMGKIKDHIGEFVTRVSGGKIRGRDMMDSIEGYSDIAPGQFALLLENLKSGRMSELTEDSELSERLEKLEAIAEILLPEGVGNSINLKDNTLSDIAQFDYSVKRTIIETIPGFLSKMLHQLTEINTKRNAEEQVYDFTKRAFVTTSMAADGLVKDIYGTLNTRRYVIDSTKSVISESLKTDEEKATLDSVGEDLATFTNNSIRGRFFPLIRPADLYNAMVTDDPSYNEYTRTVLAGVKNPKALLTFLSDYLYHENGELNYANHTKLLKSLTDGTTYLERAKDSMIEKLKASPSTAAVLPRIINTEKWLKDGMYEIDDDKLADILAEGAQGDGGELSDEELKKLMTEKEWKKFQSQRKQAAARKLIRSDLSGTLSSLTRGNTRKDTSASGGTGGAKFPEANELFRVNTYSDDGFRAGADYLSSVLLDPNTKSGRFLSTAKGFIDKTLSTVKDKTKQAKKEVTDHEVYTTSKRIASIIGRVPNEGLDVLYEIDKVFHEEPDTTMGILSASIKTLESGKTNPSVKPLVDKLKELEAKYNKAKKDITESNVNKLLHSETRQEAKDDITKQWDESKAKSNMNKAIQTVKDIKNPETREAALKKLEEDTGTNLTELRAKVTEGVTGAKASASEHITKLDQELGAKFSDTTDDDGKSLSAMELIARATSTKPTMSGIIKDKVNAGISSISNTEEMTKLLNPINNILPFHRKQAEFEDAATVFSGPTIPTEFTPGMDVTTSTAEVAKPVSLADRAKSRMQAFRDKFQRKPKTEATAESTEEAATSLLDMLKDKLRATVRPTGMIDTGTTMFDEDTKNILNKQVEILEIISTDTKKVIDELSAMKEGMAVLGSLAAESSQDPKKRSLLGKVFSGTATAASGLFGMGLFGAKLAAQGVVGGVVLGGKALGFGLSLPFRGAKAALQGIFGSKKTSMTDVYTPGPEGKLELLVDQHTLKQFGVFESGTKVTTVFNITEPVYHLETKDVLISEEHIKAGLYDKEGNELIDTKSKTEFLKKLLSPIGTLAKLPFKLMGLWAGGIGSAAGLLFTGVGMLFGKRNPYVDVYLKGNVAPGKQLLYGEAIKKGEYCRLDGSVLKSAYEIDGAIYARDGKSIGNCLITEDQIKKGLVDIQNRSLASKYGKSIIRRVAGTATRLAAAGIGLGIKATKAVASGLYNLATLPFKGVKALGSKWLRDKKAQSGIPLPVSSEDVKVLVGDKLDSIIDILKRGFNIGVEDDRSGDGLRDNSYEAWKKNKTEQDKFRAEQRAQRDARRRSKLGGIKPLVPGATDEEGGSSWFDTFTGSGAAIATWLGGTKVGKWIGNTKLGKWGGKLLGSTSGLADDAAQAATKPGMTAKARAFISKYGMKAFSKLPTKAKIALGIGGAALGVSAFSDDADAAEEERLLGVTSNTSGAIANSNPYKNTTPGDPDYTPARRDATDYDSTFLEARSVAYGFKEDYTQIRKMLATIEQHAYNAYTSNVPVPDSVLLEIAGNYVDVNENQQSVLSYFKEWWNARVLPVYYTYLKTLEAFKIDLDTRDYFGAETDDETKKLAFETYKTEYKKLLSSNRTIRSLIPSKDGYDVWLVSSKYLTKQNLESKAEDIKTSGVDKATENMTWMDKVLTTAGVTTGAGVLSKFIPEGVKSTISGAASTGLSKLKGIGSKIPGLGALIEGGFVAKEAYDAHEEGDTDSMVQRIVRGTGSILGGIVGGAIVGGTTGGVGAVAGYMGGSYAGEMMAGKLAGRISAWFSDDSGPGIFGKPANEWSLFKARVDMYGVDDPSKYERIIDYLEEDAIEMVEQNNIGEMDDNRAYKFADRLGYDPKTNTTDKIKHFKLWYTQRFYPIFYAFYNILNAIGVSYDDLSSISKKHVEVVITNLAKACGSVLSNFSELKPTLDSYGKWIKLRDGDTAELSEPLDSRTLAEMKNKQDAIITKTSKNTDATEKERKAALAMSQVKEPTAATDASGEVKSGGTPTAGGATVTAGTMTTTDTTGSGSTPANVQGSKDAINNKVGSVSAGFESGGKGSMAIGWDRTGGTSYGKYQFAAKTGSLAEFILWLMQNGGEKFATRMVQAVGYMPNNTNSKGWGETGGKTGAPVDAWIAGVAAGELGDLESQFFKGKLSSLSNRIARGFKFKSTKYPGDPQLANMIQGNPGLLEMANSTIVQHGDSGGASILMRAKDEDEVKYVNNVYRIRGTQFQSSTPQVRASVLNRFDRERPKIVEMVKQYLSSKPSDTTDTGDSIEELDSAASVTGGSAANMSVGLAAQGASTTSIPAGMSVDRGASSGSGSTSISVAGETSGPNMSAAGASGTTDINIQQPNGSTVATGEKHDGSLDEVKRADSGVDIQNLHPRLRKALAGLNSEFKDKFGSPITVNSGYRSLAKQQALYDKYGPGRAARPNPRAPHMFMQDGQPAAIAFDASSSQMNKADNAGLLAKYGLSRPLWPKGKGRVKPEPWHVQLTDTTRMTTEEDLAETTEKPEVDTTVASSVKEASQAYTATTTGTTNSDTSSGDIASGSSTSGNVDPLAQAVSTVPSISGGNTSAVAAISASPSVDPMKDAGNVSDTSSSSESIAMMQLEQLKLMVSSLTSISDNTKTLPELSMENLEKPIMSLVDHISEALSNFTGGGTDTESGNRGSSSSKKAKPTNVSSNRVNPGTPTINISSRRYGV